MRQDGLGSHCVHDSNPQKGKEQIMTPQHKNIQKPIVISKDEAEIAGVNPADDAAMRALQQKLSEWDYVTQQSAKMAYANPCIERLQLLRQIKNLLKDDMGFSTLYNKLEPTRGKDARRLAEATRHVLQPWTCLGSSVRLRDFVSEHRKFLGGYIVNKKWRHG